MPLVPSFALSSSSSISAEGIASSHATPPLAPGRKLTLRVRVWTREPLSFLFVYIFTFLPEELGLTLALTSIAEPPDIIDADDSEMFGLISELEV